jgi:hypothetical protein
MLGQVPRYPLVSGPPGGEVKMTTLALRSIGSNNFAVLDDVHPVGRIRYAAERTNEVWMWNVTVAVPGGGHGTSPGLEEAKSTFKERWFKFKAEIGLTGSRRTYRTAPPTHPECRGG